MAKRFLSTMTTMKRLCLGLLLAAGVGAGAPALAASEGGHPWDVFPLEKMTDTAALQRGARTFVNYCLSCHSASYMRYNRLQDIGLTEASIKQNLLFATDKVGSTMKTAIDPRQAKEFFGATPPDLSVITRSRSVIGKGSGADYLYSLWRGYYRDDAKPTGWNNLIYPDIGMPHALWQLQGERRARFVDEADPQDAARQVRRFAGFEQITPGSMSEREFDETVADLVAFLNWMGEPSAAQRIRVGVGVLIFLGILIVFTWRLNASYWRAVE